MTTSTLADKLAEARAEADRLRAELPQLTRENRDTMSVGDRYFSPNLGGAMTIVRIGQTSAGRGRIQLVYASSDGRPVTLEYHRDEPESSEPPVYFEVAGPGTNLHGWLDAASRKVVQSG